MKKFAKLAVAAAIVGMSFAASAAPILIDDFSTGQTQLYDQITDASGLASAQNGANIIGGQRELFVLKNGASSSDTDPAGVKIGVSTGQLKFSSDTGDNGYGVVRWDGSKTSTAADFVSGGLNGIDATGLGAVNFATSALGFLLTVVSSDADFPFTLNAYTDAGNWTSLTFGALGVPTGTGPVDFFVPFSDFFGPDVDNGGVPDSEGIISRISFGTGIDFLKVGALEAVINTGGAIADVDIRLDLVQAVPEPESLALVGLGLLGLAAIRRRKSVN